MAFSGAVHDKLGLNTVFILRVELSSQQDAFAGAVSAICASGAKVSDVRLRDDVSHADGLVYDFTIFTNGDDQLAVVEKAVNAVVGAKVLEAIDPALESHRGGACEMRAKVPIKSDTDLRIVYTPGVARVCRKIQEDPKSARELTNIANKVAIVTDGTAILGLGDIGPLAGLPVIEGKSAIFWEFASVSAEPVLIDTRDADEFINIVEKLAIGFGAIQVEDIAAPNCFKITRELDRRLDIPVMHDDQHGTAAIVMAGLFSALKKTGKKISDLTCVISGAGAAGTAIADLMMHEGLADVVLCDSAGVIYKGRTERMNSEKVALAERTNKENFSGTLADAFKGRDIFVGVSMANIVDEKMIRSMSADPIVFALANPVSEISKPDALNAGAVIYADGRMMNNALAYPGIFRGALDSGATQITMQMVCAAARTLAALAGDDQLLPEMMDPKTHASVAMAVNDSAGEGDPLV